MIILLLAVAALGVYKHLELKKALSDKAKLSEQLIDSQAEEKSLTTALDEANLSLEVIQAELDKRDELAAKAIAHAKRLDDVVTNQREQLTALKNQNEEFNDWTSQPVPDVVGRLLIDARAQIKGSG